MIILSLEFPTVSEWHLTGAVLIHSSSVSSSSRSFILLPQAVEELTFYFCFWFPPNCAVYQQRNLAAFHLFQSRWHPITVHRKSLGIFDDLLPLCEGYFPSRRFRHSQDFLNAHSSLAHKHERRCFIQILIPFQLFLNSGLSNIATRTTRAQSLLTL